MFASVQRCLPFFGLLAGSLLLPAAGETAPPPKATSPAEGALPNRSFETSVVRLINTSQRADPATPWNLGRPKQGTGSGFVVEGGRILTNAHVVADSRNIVLLLHGDATPHDARIIAVGHDCDLALVEPVDSKLLAGIPPLTIGENPNLGDAVVTLGYPAGGRWLSSTRGVVSRIDYNPSAHSGASHLSVQTDAAINPGNSGGPVMGDGRVVGVAYQANGGLENTGYFLPPLILKHFLTDVADGRYDGFPQLDVLSAGLDNAAARRRVGLAEGETGVQIYFVHPATPAYGILKPGDVLLELGGEVVANDGTVAWGTQRLQASVVLDRYFVGDRVPVRVLRAGERLNLTVPVAVSVYPIRSYDVLPTYLVYAGLVFVPLDREAVSNSPPTALLYDYWFRQISHPDAPLPGRVMLLRRLDHEVNSNLSIPPSSIIERVNGKEVTDLTSLAAALSLNADRWHVFESAYGGQIGVLDRAAADAAHVPILEQYAVPKDRRL